jgi:hypothetical protein
MSHQKINEKPSAKRFKQTTLFFAQSNSNVTKSPPNSSNEQSTDAIISNNATTSNCTNFSLNSNCEQPKDNPFIGTFPTNSEEVILSPFCNATENVAPTEKNEQLPELPIFSNDIALAFNYKTPITPHKRHELLTQNWSPSEDYVFPTWSEGGQKRRFNVKWLKRFPWLVYSPSKEGAFCKVGQQYLIL